MFKPTVVCLWFSKGFITLDCAVVYLRRGFAMLSRLPQTCDFSPPLPLSAEIIRPAEYPPFLVHTCTPPSTRSELTVVYSATSLLANLQVLVAYSDEGRDHLNSLVSPHYSGKAGSAEIKPFSPLSFSEHMVTVALGITSPDYFRHSPLGHATLLLTVAASQAHSRLLLTLLSFVHRENRNTALPIQGSGSCRPGC